MNTKVKYAVFSDAGSRAINEDSVGVFENRGRYCFVLCDGLGGHGMGEVASKLTVDVFENQFSNFTDPTQFLDNAFCAAQDVLIAEQKARNVPQKMKTTAVVLHVDEKRICIGHIGDSRLYAFSRNNLKFRTLDHSVPQMLVLSKEIKESQIRNHPERSVLLRTLGVPWEKKSFELTKPMSIKKYQAFLLCSDGFWELINEDSMCDLLKNAKTVEDWLSDMIRVVKTNGMNRDMDNYSAIAIWL